MREHISSADFLAVLHESFGRGQELIFTPSGTSMLPMLDGMNDKVRLSPPPARLRRYDVAFYLRPETGLPVLHRVVGFTKDGGYVFCGDNQYDYEYGVTDADIYAVMTAFTHKGRERRVSELSYRLYVRQMAWRKRLHRLLSKIYHKVITIKPRS